MLKRLVPLAAAIAAMSMAGAAYAGPVFLTGHDPDFHAQGQASGVHELQVALNYVTGGTYNTGSERFLFVESAIPATSGHRNGVNGLTGSLALNQGLGLVQGVNFDLVNGAGFTALTNFDAYSAIVVASSFGGMLTDAEILALNARATDIASFVNAGGGLAAFAECGPGFFNCQSEYVSASTPLFGFVPVGVSSVNTAQPYTLTPFGLGLGLVESDVDDCCTHNSFAGPAGLNVVDFDANGVPTTLAGNVRIGDGGFEPGVPEPATWSLLILGFGLAGAALRRRRASMATA